MQVLAQVYTMHHNAELWSEPDKFDPERYVDTCTIYVCTSLACTKVLQKIIMLLSVSFTVIILLSDLHFKLVPRQCTHSVFVI